MIPFDEKYFINLAHVCIDHDDDNETQLMVSVQIFVKPLGKNLKLKFVERSLNPETLIWKCDFDINEHLENDENVVAEENIIIDGVTYLMFIFKKKLPQEGLAWYQFFPKLYINGQLQKLHDGTIHKPSFNGDD